MNKLFGAAALAATLCVGMHPALAAESASENRSVDARIVKIKLDGVINLNVKQGASAALVVYGEKDEIAKVTTTQNGDTLHIDTASRNHFHFGNSKELRAELTLPNLAELRSQGVGATEVSGFSGDTIKIDLDGAGSMVVTVHYKRVLAHLSGVGSMTLNSGESDSVDLGMRGAGQISVNGQSKLLHAKLGGLGSLDAKKLVADAVDLDMAGLGGATVYAKNSAALHLAGMGSATVYGKPAKRTSSAVGMGSIDWN